MNKVKRSALVQLGRWRGGGQVPEDVSMRVWPTLAVGLEPDGAAGHALIYAAHLGPGSGWPQLPFTALPLIGVTRVGSKGAVGFAPCDAVVPITSGVSRIGVGASLLIFLFVSLT